MMKGAGAGGVVPPLGGGVSVPPPLLEPPEPPPPPPHAAMEAANAVIKTILVIFMGYALLVIYDFFMRYNASCCQ